MKQGVARRGRTSVWRMPAAILYCLTTLTFSAEVIVDNGDPGTESTGSWNISGGYDPYDPGDPEATSLWARDGATYTWSFDSQPTGMYEVFIWYSGFSSRATNVPVEINHFGGATNKTINQQDNPGAWNSLGEFYFDGAGSVMITAVSGSGISTCADAVRFEQVLDVPLQVIIDNRSASTSQTGEWSVSSGPNPYGTDSFWSRDGSTFTFEFTAPASGDYQLSMWWTEWSSRGLNIPVTIESDSLPDTVFVNQTTDGGQWNLLGIYPFTSGETYFITVTAVSGPASTCADAVMLEYAEERELDHIVILGPETAMENTSIQYQCQAHYTNGSTAIVEASWNAVSGPVDINTNGLLTAQAVESDTPFQINVSYTEDTITREADKLGTVTVFTPPPEIIIDNGDPNTSSSGSWNTSSGPDPYGLDSLWSRDGATYTWSFTPVVAAYYKIEMWWTQFSSRSQEIPVQIMQGTTLLNSREVNQQENGGQWNSVAIVFLEAGQSCNVTIIAQPGPSSTCADAVRFAISDPPALDSLEISGPMSVDNHTTAQYTCLARYTDGSSTDISPDSWSLDVNQAYAEISDSGLLTAYAVTGDLECYISSTYTDGDNTKTGKFRVFIRDLVPPVAVDNDSADTSFTGTWDISSGPDPYGGSSLYSRNGATYTWYFTPAATGFFEVQMWWTQFSSRTSAAQISVLHADGTATLYADQRSNGGQWNLLDVFRFEANTEYRVTITAASGSSSTCADAVRFVNVPAPEHIYACPGYASVDATPEIVDLMEELNARELNPDLWTFKNTDLNQHFTVHIIHDIAGMKQALMTEDAHVVYFGHSNYGLGALFTNEYEFQTQVVEDIFYVDDPRIFNYSSPMVRISASGMRTGQAYPSWWPIFQDGTSAIMPYEHGDPRGDPPYNYFVTYQIPGDPSGMHYKVDSPRHQPIERFPDSDRPAWYAEDGSTPDSSNPDHLQFFITNTEEWKPSIDYIGDWRQSLTIEGYWKEDYYITDAGNGEEWFKWLFDVPNSGNYEISAWWSATSSRTPNAPYTITHAGGETTVTKDQRYAGGVWNSLGVFPFDAQEYSVTLSNDASSGGVIADGIRVTHEDNPPEIIKAQPYAQVRQGQAPYEVIFRHDSTGDHTQRYWDFGDGHTNETRDRAEHTYAAPGLYTVTLTIVGPAGTDTVTLNDYIRITAEADEPERLMAEFSASGEEGTIPRDVRFWDYSSGEIVEWFWEFGDGTTSTEQYPSHLYTEPGIYDVRLTVTDINGFTSVKERSQYVRTVIFEKIIDNVDYPKTHYGNKIVTWGYPGEKEITLDEMKYQRLLYVGCDSGHYFTDTFQRGLMFYALQSSSTGAAAIPLYLRAYLQGKTDHQIWEILMNLAPIFDYYDFTKPPDQQPD